MSFCKIQTMGNRFFLWEGTLPHPERWAKRLCRGGRADGLLILTAAEDADGRLVIYNADGSRAGICGNGLCCVARYLDCKGRLCGGKAVIATDAGRRQVQLWSEGDLCRIRVCMEQAKVAPPRRLQALGRCWTGYPVWVGNPHFVILTENVEQVDLGRLGAAISRQFAHGCNVEAVQLSADGVFRLRVWERGVGLTAACGSGICAAAAVLAAKEGASSVRAQVWEK